MSLNNKRIALYIPGLIMYGGGAEVYGLQLAEILDRNNRVIILTHDPHNESFNINSVYDMYGTKHFETRFLKYKKIKHLNGIQIWKNMDRMSSEFDLFINCTYGIMRGMRNTLSIHLIHFPFPRQTGIIGRIYNNEYVKSYNAYICNSKYTQRYLKQYWDVDSKILYPPIAMDTVDYDVIINKEKIILAVGRIVKDKKILEMIDAFKRICNDGIKDYKFVIIGNKDDKELNYLDRVIKTIKDYPIELYTNIDKTELVGWYRKASIFWHAKGLNEDEDPYNSEHFGMTTVEAMANGCLPIVINKAGQKEIVNHEINGYRWNTIDELVDYTLLVMSDRKRKFNIQIRAVDDSKEYLLEQFKKNANRVLDEIIEANTFKETY